MDQYSQQFINVLTLFNVINVLILITTVYRSK